MRFLYLLLAVLILSCAPKEQTAQEKKKDTSDLKPYSEVYENGQTHIQGNLLDDKRHGLWASYYLNGVKWSEDEYYEGQRNGKTISYYPSGLFRYKGTYIDDEPAGNWIFYDEEGKIQKEEDFSKK
jgi:antitoxin component YwqK of YwqJK toxin-antitoxin module